METVAKFQIERAQTIEQLTTFLTHLKSLKSPTGKAYSAQLPLVITPTIKSDKIIQITMIIQAVMESQSKTTEVGNKGNCDGTKTKRKWTTNDNDLTNAQHSKICRTKSYSYFHSWGFELTFKHYSKTFKCKMEGHKDYATINNRMGGSERNFYHYTCKWWCVRTDKSYSSLNQLTYKTTDLKESNNNNQKQWSLLA